MFALMANQISDKISCDVDKRLTVIFIIILFFHFEVKGKGSLKKNLIM